MYDKKCEDEDEDENNNDRDDCPCKLHAIAVAGVLNLMRSWMNDARSDHGGPHVNVVQAQEKLTSAITRAAPPKKNRSEQLLQRNNVGTGCAPAGAFVW